MWDFKGEDRCFRGFSPSNPTLHASVVLSSHDPPIHRHSRASHLRVGNDGASSPSRRPRMQTHPQHPSEPADTPQDGSLESERKRAVAPWMPLAPTPPKGDQDESATKEKNHAPCFQTRDKQGGKGRNSSRGPSHAVVEGSRRTHRRRFAATKAYVYFHTNVV